MTIVYFPTSSFFKEILCCPFQSSFAFQILEPSWCLCWWCWACSSSLTLCPFLAQGLYCQALLEYKSYSNFHNSEELHPSHFITSSYHPSHLSIGTHPKEMRNILFLGNWLSSLLIIFVWANLCFRMMTRLGKTQTNSSVV